jgi:phytanoyl-CoA hydroxylase
MNFALTASELAFYATQGYLVRESEFNDNEVTDLQDAAECAATEALRLAAKGQTYTLDGRGFTDVERMTLQFEKATECPLLRVIEPVDHLDPRLTRLVEDRRLVEPMKQLVGTQNIALWTDKLNLKRPRQGSGFGWHQDSPYWIHDCQHVDQLPNVMLTFDQATEANGCLRIIRGSHLQGRLPGTDDGSQLGGFFTSPAYFDEALQVALTVPAGSLIFFSPHLVHGSAPNTTNTPRRAIILTYQPADYPMLKNGEVRNIRH